MKICEINSGLIAIPPDGAGAVEKIILSLSTELGKHGHEVYIVDIATKTQFDSPKNIVFKRVPNLPIANKGFSHMAKGIYFMFASTFMVGKLIHEDKVDIIHIHNQFSGFLITILNKIFWKKPLVFTTHNQEIFEKSLKNTITCWPEKFLLKHVETVVCVSPTVKQLLISTLGIAEQKLVQIYSGVEFGATGAKTKKAKASAFKIIIVARIVPRKNQLAVIEASKEVIKQFPQTTFQFIGPVDDDAYFDQLKQLVTDYGLENKVQLSGEVSKSALNAAYADADLFVLTSTNENQGLVILEAMAHSIPVICSSIGPFKDMLSGQEDAAIMVDNASELATAILKLISNTELRDHQVSQATKLVSKFSWDTIAQEYEAVFHKLTTKP